ncbi:hypothetical protein VTN00DRAFT_8694 [Thermoascus crustaceus]|uniref:uncharacterized protein n=1 Tax=Thermoascus crustaceus TaxID=5088 RepID=UPI00374436AC
MGLPWQSEGSMMCAWPMLRAARTPSTSRPFARVVLFPSWPARGKVEHGQHHRRMQQQSIRQGKDLKIRPARLGMRADRKPELRIGKRGRDWLRRLNTATGAPSRSTIHGPLQLFAEREQWPDDDQAAAPASMKLAPGDTCQCSRRSEVGVYCHRPARTRDLPDVSRLRCLSLIEDPARFRCSKVALLHSEAPIQELQETGCSGSRASPPFKALGN